MSLLNRLARRYGYLPAREAEDRLAAEVSQRIEAEMLRDSAEAEAQERATAIRELEGCLAIRVEEAVTETEQRVTASLAKSLVERTIADSPMMGVAGWSGSEKRPIYQLDNPWRFYTNMTPRKRPDAAVDLATLRRIADTYDILRSCILDLQRSVAETPLRVQHRDPRQARDGASDYIQKAQELFSTRGPIGGLGKTREHFETMMIEDALVVGAYAAFKYKTLGNAITEIHAIDAATIKPVVDAFGWDPDGPTYEQWIMGLRVDTYDSSMMVYNGMHPRTYTPFYIGPIEWLILAVQSALKADEWNREWLTHGDMPSDLIALPEDWDQKQIELFQSYWEALLAGNTRQRARTKFVPSGSQRVNGASRKDQEFHEMEMWLARRTCAVMGVLPASIGLEERIPRAGIADQVQQTARYGVGPLLSLRKSLYDDVLYEFGFEDLEVQNVTDRNEDAAARGQRLMVSVGGPWMSVNEARKEDGLPPLPEEEFDTVRDITQDANASGNAREKSNSARQTAVKTTGKNGDGGSRADLIEALALWQDKAKRRLASSGSAVCEFEHDGIDEETRVLVSERLQSVTTRGELLEAFGSLVSDFEA